MRLLTKAEACRELVVSLSTLDRRITSGELSARREPHGRRHRVHVMLDDDPPEDGDAVALSLAVAQERIRGLEEQVALLQGQIEAERERYAGLLDDVKAGKFPVLAQGRRRSWWRFWERGQ